MLIRGDCFLALWSNVLPLRLVWLTGLFRIIGGGDQVVVSIALVMVADIFSEEERYASNDSPVFYLTLLTRR